VHETLAEIARYDATGFPEDAWPDLATRPEWVALYDFVNATYDRLTGQHVSTPLAPRVAQHVPKVAQPSIELSQLPPEMLQSLRQT
jgi:hypothetical protein